MYCVKCGTKAKDGQKKCLACGMRLISPEALLKLLRKADLEKKLSRMDQPAPVKPEKKDGFVKGYMDRLRRDEADAGSLRKKKTAEEIKKSAPAKAKKSTEEVKRPAPAKEKKPDVKPAGKPENTGNDKERKRVTPLFENPTQPRRRSIFDDEPAETASVKAKTVSGGGGKPKPAKKPVVSDKKPAASKNNPVVKLPEKRKTLSESRKRDEGGKRTASQRIYFSEREEEFKKNAAPKKNAGAKRPDRTKSAPKRNNVTVKRKTPAGTKASSGGSGGQKRRPKRDEENFVEKYLRSIISMMLLTTSVILMLMWGYATDTGNRTMAELGLGSRQGYILLGDDCMADGNYKRAVEHYYKALSKRVNYEAGIKLARAYRMTGEGEKETSALLLLMDRYQGTEEPYQRLLELYPDPYSRPEKVQLALNMHER